MTHAPSASLFVDTVWAYPLYVALAVLVGLAIVLGSAHRAAIPLRRFLWLYLVITVAAVIGAKVASILERGGALNVLSWEIANGYRYPGAVVSGVLAAAVGSWVLSPLLSLGMLADLLAPATAFSVATVRVGCFLTGCCTGNVCDLPWAVRFPPGTQAWQHQVAQGLIAKDATQTLPAHPLQLYFLLLSLSVGVFLLWFQRKKTYQGQLFLVYLALHEPGKFLLEFLRDERLPHLQFLSLVLALVAAGVLLARAHSGTTTVSAGIRE